MNPASFYIDGEQIRVSPIPRQPERTVRGWVWVVFVLLLAAVAGSLDGWVDSQVANQTNQRENQ